MHSPNHPENVCSRSGGRTASLLLAGLMSAGAVVAQTAIPIPNASFEDAAGYWTATNWSANFTPGNENAEIAIEIKTDEIPGKDGSNFLNLFIHNDLGDGTSYGEVVSDVLGTFAADTLYTLTVALANENESAGRTLLMGLQANDVTVGGKEIASELLAAGMFVDHTFTLDTSANPGVVGQSIRVVLGNTHPGEYGRSFFFDHVRLSEEPATGGESQPYTPITTTVTAGGDLELGFATVSGKSYRVVTAAAPDGPWLDLANPMWGTGDGNPTSVEVALPATGPAQFFTIEFEE